MKAAGVLSAAAALLGAGLTLAQEAPPSSQPAAPPFEAPSVAPSPPAAEAAPPEETAAVPRLAAEVPDDAPATAPAPPPLKRPRYAAAILQGVDKITAETMRFEARVGEPVRYKGLVLTVHACEGTASDENRPDSWANLDVTAQPRTPPGRLAPAPRQVFRGWMSAASPSLHPFENAGYDLWLIACRTAAPDTPADGQA